MVAVGNFDQSSVNAYRSPVQLLEDFHPLTWTIEEDRSSGKLVMRGEFARAGVATENKRLYTDQLWERELLRLDKALSERRVFGELDHPSDGRTQLQRVSHIVTGLRLENGVVVGEAEILNTSRGRDLRAIIESGARCGVSSRGYGSTVTDAKGNEVVQEDYKLVTFDFVAEPANVTSFPEVQKTKGEAKEPIRMAAKAEEERKAPEPKVAEEKVSKPSEPAPPAVEAKSEEEPKVSLETATLPSDFAAQILNLVRENAVPEDAAKVIAERDAEIERLKTELAERDSKISSLEEEVDAVAGVAREIGWKYFLETQISDSPDSGMLRRMVGEVRQYSSPDEIVARLQEAKKELKEARAKQSKVEARRRRELAVVEEDKRQVSERLSKTESALEKAVELNQALSLKLYAENRLATHPRAGELRPLIEQVKPDSKEDVDKLIDEHKEAPRHDPDVLEKIRSRVRARTNGGFSSSPLEEETGSPSGLPQQGNQTADYNGLGVSLGELKALAELN